MEEQKLSIAEQARLLAGEPQTGDLCHLAEESERADTQRRLNRGARLVETAKLISAVAREANDEARASVAEELESLAAASVYYTEIISAGEEDLWRSRNTPRRWHWDAETERLVAVQRWSGR